ncbi:MAG: dihydrofolate reductase [Rhodothermales bacterium]|nr:dihydrofolate reductase [Rhodothermales bacterium]
MPDKPSRPQIVVIAAVATRNRVIGDGLDLPWRIPEDLKRFKRLTLGHPMIMGRRTFDSLVEQFGGPLKGRRLLVLSSRGQMESFPQIEVFPSIAEALEAVRDDELVFIGGGGGVYEEFIPLADTLELTEVEGDYSGDTFFPPYEHLIGSEFEEVQREDRDGFSFVTYERICR